MKQKLFDALKAKFPGVNANVLNRIAEKLAKTVTTDEQVTTAVAGVYRNHRELRRQPCDRSPTDSRTHLRNEVRSERRAENRR